MKRFLLIPLLFGSLALAGCETAGKFVSVVTTSIDNPVSTVDIYRIKTVYATADQLVIDYRKYCWARPYAVLMADPIAAPICQNRRTVVRKAQTYRARASAAINAADKFVRANPTIGAKSLLDAAWSAVTVYRGAVPKLN